MRQQANVVQESALLKILHDQEMTKAEKRAIFASWISDARAVPNAPAWRQVGGATILHLDQILEALKLLDDGESPMPDYKPKRPSPLSFNRRRRNLKRHQKLPRWFWRNDDDPPPAPTAATASSSVASTLPVSAARALTSDSFNANMRSLCFGNEFEITQSA